MDGRILNWLEANQYIAIWLEGIALLLIFGWDRYDSHQQHKETLRQLNIAQQHVDVSQRQVEAALEQVEASRKPFLAFSSAPRDATEAVLDMNGAVGTTMIRLPNGIAELTNDGSGSAVNVSYIATPLDPNSTIARPSGYLARINTGDRSPLPLSRGILQGNDWQIVVDYESLSGRKYRTTTTVRSLVLTDIKFDQRG